MKKIQQMKKSNTMENYWQMNFIKHSYKQFQNMTIILGKLFLDLSALNCQITLSSIWFCFMINQYYVGTNLDILDRFCFKSAIGSDD